MDGREVCSTAAHDHRGIITVLERHGCEWGPNRSLWAGGGDGIQWRASLRRGNRSSSQRECGRSWSVLRGGDVEEQRRGTAAGTASAPTVQPRCRLDAVKPVGRRLVWRGQENERGVRAARGGGEEAGGEVGGCWRGAAACDLARAPELSRGAAARADQEVSRRDTQSGRCAEAAGTVHVLDRLEFGQPGGAWRGRRRQRRRRHLAWHG